MPGERIVEISLHPMELEEDGSAMIFRDDQWHRAGECANCHQMGPAGDICRRCNSAGYEAPDIASVTNEPIDQTERARAIPEQRANLAQDIIGDVPRVPGSPFVVPDSSETRIDRDDNLWVYLDGHWRLVGICFVCKRNGVSRQSLPDVPENRSRLYPK